METFLALEQPRVEQHMGSPVKLFWSNGVAFQSSMLEDPYRGMKEAGADFSKSAGSGEATSKQ